MEPIYVYNLPREDKINTILKEIGSENLDRDRTLIGPIIDYIAGIAQGQTFEIDGKSYFILTALDPTPIEGDDRQHIILYKIVNDRHYRLALVDLRNKIRSEKIDNITN